MDRFKLVLKKRLLLMFLLNVITILLIILTRTYSHLIVGSNVHIEEYINGFQVGIFLSVEIRILYRIIKYRKALNDEEELKKLYIKENDERAKLIRDKIGGDGFLFSVGMVAIGTVIAGFFNETVFFTLFAVTVFMAMILASLKLYYNNKY